MKDRGRLDRIGQVGAAATRQEPLGSADPVMSSLATVSPMVVARKVAAL